MAERIPHQSPEAKGAKESGVRTMKFYFKKYGIFMFIGGILIIIAAFASVYLSSKIADAKMNDYPDSGLREQPSGQEYTLPDYLNVVFKCPTLPFILNLPGEVKRSNETAIIVQYENYTIVMGEGLSEDDAGYSVMCNLLAGMDTWDTPDVITTTYKEESGYLGRFRAEYTAGALKIKHLTFSNQYFSCRYKFFLSKNTNLYVMILTDELSEISEGKRILDDIGKSLLCVDSTYDYEYIDDTDKENAAEKKVFQKESAKKLDATTEE